MIFVDYFEVLVQTIRAIPGCSLTVSVVVEAAALAYIAEMLENCVLGTFSMVRQCIDNTFAI